MTLTQSTQFSMDTTMTIVYYAGKITTADADGVKFECYDPKIFRIKEDVTIEELRQKIHEKIRPGSRRISEIYYRCPVTVASGRVQYWLMQLQNGGDIARMFAAFSDHASYGPIELYAQLARSTDEILSLLRQPRSRTVDEIIACCREPDSST